MDRLGLREWVQVLVGASVDVGASWVGPVRLLFLDGDHTYQATRADFAIWKNHVVHGGLVVFHDVDVSPGVTQCYHEIMAQPRPWKEISRVRSLRVVQYGS